MLGSTTWFTAHWSEQKHQPSRSPRVSAETTERDPMAWRWCLDSRDAVPRGMWQLLTHWQHPTCRKMRATGRKCCVGKKDDQVQYSTLSASRHVFYPMAVETVGSLSDEAHSLMAEISWSATNTLHSRSAGNYVPVPTYFHSNSAFQCSVSCQHIHSFRVPIVTTRSGDTFLLLLIIRPWECITILPEQKI